MLLRLSTTFSSFSPLSALEHTHFRYRHRAQLESPLPSRKAVSVSDGEASPATTGSVEEGASPSTPPSPRRPTVLASSRGLGSFGRGDSTETPRTMSTDKMSVQDPVDGSKYHLFSYILLLFMQSQTAPSPTPSLPHSHSLTATTQLLRRLRAPKAVQRPAMISSTTRSASSCRRCSMRALSLRSLGPKHGTLAAVTATFSP